MALRLETGPVQAGDDWPGLFIRGDNAASYASILESYLDRQDARHANTPITRVPEKGAEAIHRAYLRGLVTLLRSPIDAHHGDNVQKVTLP